MTRSHFNINGEILADMLGLPGFARVIDARKGDDGAVVLQIEHHSPHVIPEGEVSLAYRSTRGAGGSTVAVFDCANPVGADAAKPFKATGGHVCVGPDTREEARAIVRGSLVGRGEGKSFRQLKALCELAAGGAHVGFIVPSPSAIEYFADLAIFAGVNTTGKTPTFMHSQRVLLVGKGTVRFAADGEAVNWRGLGVSMVVVDHAAQGNVRGAEGIVRGYISDKPDLEHGAQSHAPETKDTVAPVVHVVSDGKEPVDDSVARAISANIDAAARHPSKNT